MASADQQCIHRIAGNTLQIIAVAAAVVLQMAYHGLNRIASFQLSRELSRLSRTDKDWCHLLELCQIFNTLIADADNLYDLNRLDS